MALFNFISLVSFRQVLMEDRFSQLLASQESHHVDLKAIVLYPKMKKTLTTQNSVVLYNSHKKLLLAAESVYRFSKSYNSHPGLLNDLMNKYWQQTIFLSLSNPLSKDYINQISKQDSAIIKRLKKNFLITFSNALLEKHIDASRIISPNSTSSLPLTYVKYQWKKGFNLELPKNIFTILIQSKNIYFSNKQTQDLVYKLKYNNIPLFVVTNCFKQLIVSEPSSKTLSSRTVGNNISQWYNYRLLNSQNNQDIYESWFFVNPKDADEYKNYIFSQYNRSSKQHQIATTSSSIAFYYHLNRNSPSKLEFRLFPDLQEVGSLIKDRKFRQNIFFDKRQNYGKSYFQGQPIYFIEPVLCSKNNTTKKVLLNYYYNIPNDLSSKKYNAVFFSKKTALKGWDYFRNQMIEYNLPARPILRVYNLEDFFKDMEANKSIQDKNILFIPNLASYQHIEQQYLNQEVKTNFNIASQYLNLYISTAQLWCQRIIVSLTSKQPPSW